MNINANYSVVSLSGTSDSSYLGNSITASTVHQIYCLSAGSIELTPLDGPTFTWNGTTNSSIDILVSKTKVISGNFIGFRTKSQPVQYINY